MQSVVITGASSGIGWATAKLLLDRGFRVFGIVRKHADADRLGREFGANFIPLLFDVTDEAAVLAAARQVRAALNGETLFGLVNNAGISVAGPVLELAADEFRRQMEVNVIGPVITTQAFGPLLGADPSLRGPKGRIVMISSVAGKNGNPLSALYVASKHAIEGLSESLRRELMLFGIDAIIIAPGPVKTPIWSKAEEVDISSYQSEPEQSCDGNTCQMVECLKARTAQWDKRMTIAYQQALKDAGEKQREQLRAAQRLWIQYRDANCLYYGLGEGTIARIDAGECMRNMTKTRAEELEGLGHQ